MEISYVSPNVRIGIDSWRHYYLYRWWWVPQAKMWTNCWLQWTKNLVTLIRYMYQVKLNELFFVAW